jgi:hypothetical protein
MNKMPTLLDPKHEYLIRSGSAGETGQSTDECIRNEDVDISDSFYSHPFSSCYESLFEIIENCSMPGWDGYEADPISPEVYLKTIDLLCNLPLGTPCPELVPENDGAITIEWQVNQKQELSLSINPNNLGYYVFTDGSEKTKGAYVLQESLSPFFLNMINQIYFK